MFPFIPILAPLLGLTSVVATTAFAINENANDELYKKVKDTLSTDEAMVVLGMSKPTILKKMKYEKTLPYSGPGGRIGYRLRKEDVAEYAKNNHITPRWDKILDQSREQPQFSPEISLNPTDYESFLNQITKKPAILDSLIELTKTKQKQAQLKLQELKLEDDAILNTKEHKIKVIQMELEISKYEEQLLQYNILKETIKTD